MIGVLLCFAVGIWSVFSMSGDVKYSKIDMVYINEQYQDVIAQLQSDENEKTLRDMEEQYDCKIYLRQDEEYQTKVNNAIRNQEIVLDYEKVVDDQTIVMGKIVFTGQQGNISLFLKDISNHVMILLGIIFLAICALFVLIYVEYIRPFRKLERFAGNISKGNFDMPLTIGKRNYFGAFTESFDIMREELKRARQSEYEANTSKKELVASLSHDIKTPVSTIKALCEILEIKITSAPENEKIQVIEQKADVINHLIDDMFHSTLDELEKLKISPTEEMSTIVVPMFQEINHYGKIHLKNSVPECLIFVDALRLNQVIDNVINNSYKYANTDIDVEFEKIGNDLYIIIQDHGAGINPAELPLVLEKFYRGENSKGKDGSGLGLYLSTTFMEGMKGSLNLENNSGLRITLGIKLA